MIQLPSLHAVRGLKVCGFFYCMLVFCLLLPVQGMGASSAAQKRDALRQKQSQERLVYDACVEETQSLEATKQAEAQRLCRKNYGLKRLVHFEALWQAYDQKVLEAQEQYTDKLLAVRGKVHKAGISAMGFPEIVFALDAFGVRGVRCQFPRSAKAAVQALQAGQEVTLVGICKGFANDSVVRIINGELID